MERMVPGDPKVEPHFLKKIYLEHINRYHLASAYVRGKRVLDVGCGVGYGTAFLADKGAREVVGLDRSAEAVQYANKHYTGRQFRFTVRDCTKLPYSRSSFDVAVCLELIEHVEDCDSVMREIRRVLKPNGLLVISSPRFRGQLRSEFHVREFLFEEFRDLVQKYFKHIRVYLQNPCLINLIEPAGRARDRITNLHTLRLASFDSSTADTFVILASQLRIPSRKPTFLALGDDEYLSYLERERELLKKDWEEKEILIGGLKDQALRTEHEVESARCSERVVRNDFLNLHKSKTALGEELQGLDGELQGVRRETEAIRADFLRLQQEKEQEHLALKEQWLGEKSHLERLLRDKEQRLQLLSDANQAAHEDFLRSQRDNERLKSFLQEKSEQLAGQEQEVGSLLQKIEELNVSRAKLAQEVPEMQQQTAELESRITREKETFLGLQKEKEQEYSALKERYYTEMSEILACIETISTKV